MSTKFGFDCGNINTEELKRRAVLPVLRRHQSWLNNCSRSVAAGFCIAGQLLDNICLDRARTHLAIDAFDCIGHTNAFSSELLHDYRVILWQLLLWLLLSSCNHTHFVTQKKQMGLVDQPSFDESNHFVRQDSVCKSNAVFKALRRNGWILWGAQRCLLNWSQTRVRIIHGNWPHQIQQLHDLQLFVGTISQWFVALKGFFAVPEHQADIDAVRNGAFKLTFCSSSVHCACMYLYVTKMTQAMSEQESKKVSLGAHDTSKAPRVQGWLTYLVIKCILMPYALCHFGIHAQDHLGKQSLAEHFAKINVWSLICSRFKLIFNHKIFSTTQNKTANQRILRKMPRLVQEEAWLTQMEPAGMQLHTARSSSQVFQLRFP